MMRSLASVALSALLSAPAIAATDAVPSFEAADVHASPYRRYPDMDGGTLRGDRYVLRQATMVDLIATAYGVDQSYVQGGPIWLERDRFDVIAKAPAGTPTATLKVMPSLYWQIVSSLWFTQATCLCRPMFCPPERASRSSRRLPAQATPSAKIRKRQRSPRQIQ